MPSLKERSNLPPMSKTTAGFTSSAKAAPATSAVERARAGEGPSLIEALTYRHGGHSRADPGKYRPDDEVKGWLAKDPIPSYRAALTAREATDAQLDAIDEETRARVAEAEQEARSGPEPTADALETQVYADGGSAWRN